MLVWALLAPFLKTCPYLVALDRRFECTLNSCSWLLNMCLTNKGPDAWTCWDTAVPSAGSAAQHISFAMRRGKFHQDRLKVLLVYGSAVESLEELPEEQRREAVPWASGDVRQHQLTVPAAKINLDFRGGMHHITKAPDFILCGCLGLSEEHASTQHHSHSQSLSVGTNPLGIF